MRPRPAPHQKGPFDRLVSRAKAVLVIERLWPRVVLLASLVALFVALSWLGLWLVLPPILHAVALVGLAGALGSAILGTLRLRWPGRADAVARLDRDSGQRHRPFATSEDALANPGADPATRALWDLHRRRAQQAAARTRVAAPSPRMVERDRYALRAAAVLVLVAAAFVAGPEKAGRLAAAFTWQLPDANQPGTRVDAWIDPPAYTGKPPLILLGQGGATALPDTVSAPIGSKIMVRASGAGTVEAMGQGGVRTLPAKPVHPAADAGTPLPPSGATTDRQLALGGDGTLTITQDGATLRRFNLRAIPDLPPRVVLNGMPKTDYRGSFTVGYTLDDDYGVAGAEARFTNPRLGGRPVTGRTLVEAPKGVLTLPSAPGGIGEGKTTLDLSDHPWAGATVTLTLTARDDAGNTGESKPVDFVLPSRPFTNPLARALVEQRRILVFDPDHKERVATALDALTLAPDLFDVPMGVYLGLHAATVRLAAANTDPALIEVADLLWAMALRIENGDLSQTEQDLRAAQKALQDAMQRGASPDEMKRLTENLRRQMEKYLSELAQQQNRTGDPQQSARNERNRTITDQQLKSMLDRMEQAAKNGDMAEAQRLLDQLNSIMNNLRSAQRGNSQSHAMREMNRSMSELDRMMREQGDVRDKTFKQGNGQDLDQQSDDQAGSDGPTPQDGGDQQGAAPGDNGSGNQPSPSLRQLQRRQQALSEELRALQKRMRGLGMKGEQGFADAQEAMKEAENALGKGQPGVGDAVGAQGRALEGLQRGMNGLGQQMAQQGNGPSSNQPGQAQAPGEGDAMEEGEESTDPLGRPRQGRGEAQNDQLDVSGGTAARAARVLEELRRRLADPTRSQVEQDYLERLLNRY